MNSPSVIGLCRIGGDGRVYCNRCTPPAEKSNPSGASAGDDVQGVCFPASGAVFRAARVSMGWTLNQCAAVLMTSRNVLSKIENDRSKSVHILTLYAVLLGLVSRRHLLGSMVRP